MKKFLDVYIYIYKLRARAFNGLNKNFKELLTDAGEHYSLTQLFNVLYILARPLILRLMVVNGPPSDYYLLSLPPQDYICRRCEAYNSLLERIRECDYFGI